MPSHPGRSMETSLNPPVPGADPEAVTLTAPFHALAAAKRENRYRAERLDSPHVIPLLVVSQDPAEQLPFDWRHMPIVRYAPDSEGHAAR